MTRMTRSDCAVMCNIINTHTHTHPWEDQCEWHRMTRMTGPDCAVMCSLINTHTHTVRKTLRYRDSNSRPNMSEGYEVVN